MMSLINFWGFVINPSTCSALALCFTCRAVSFTLSGWCETMTTDLNHHHVILSASPTSTMGVCIRLPACVFVRWIYGVEGGGALRYPSAYLHQNDWLCCQQWLWPRFEGCPRPVWLKATRLCKYNGCTFVCSLHCVRKLQFGLSNRSSASLLCGGKSVEGHRVGLSLLGDIVCWDKSR